MFTGIVQEVGTLKERLTSRNRYQLVISGRKILKDINKGDSIAVNGVCLTVIDFTASSFTADVMPETLRATNLEGLKNGSPVNLEQAVRPDGFFGGHLVTGHVDGTGRIKRISSKNNARLIEISVGPDLAKFMVDKGSVALNGVSLTIIRIIGDLLTVSLIPATWNDTNLNGIKVGQEINIETDLIGKYIYKMLQTDEKQGTTAALDKKLLSDNGFI